MLNILQFIFGLLTACVAIYSLIAHNDNLLSVLSVLGGTTFLIITISEIKRKQMLNAAIFFLACLCFCSFCFF